MEKEPMTVLLVEPGKYPQVKTVPHTLKELQSLVGGLTEVVYLWPNRNACLVCNEESKLLGMPLNRAIPEIEDAIAGNFFICGLCQTEEGGDFCSLTQEQLEKFQKKYHNPELFQPTPFGLMVRRCTPEQYSRIMENPSKGKKDHGHEKR